MTLEARNLPSVASTGSVSEGRQENQRVEIYSDTDGILDTIKSTYVEENYSCYLLYYFKWLCEFLLEKIDFRP